MIDVFGTQFGYQIERLTDTQERHDKEVFGESNVLSQGTQILYPDDLARFIYMINKLKTQTSHGHRAQIKVSSFSNRKNLTQFQASSTQDTCFHSNGMLHVINNLPRCLNICSSTRKQLLKDFNDCVEDYI